MRQAEVFAELIARNVAFELVHGGMEDIGGRTFGNLTLSLRGADTDVDAALRAIDARLETRELR